MPRIAVEENERVALRLRAGDKAKIMRASALKNTDLTHFMVHTALAAAEEVIEQAERLKLTGRDSVRILELLDNPPAPNARLQIERFRNSRNNYPSHFFRATEVLQRYVDLSGVFEDISAGHQQVAIWAPDRLESGPSSY